MKKTLIRFKKMKVFDITEMPRELHDWVHAYFEKGNDVYVSWAIGDIVEDADCYNEDDVQMAKKVDAWFIAGGADEGEEVLLQYWW